VWSGKEGSSVGLSQMCSLMRQRRNVTKFWWDNVLYCSSEFARQLGREEKSCFVSRPDLTGGTADSSNGVRVPERGQTILRLSLFNSV